MGNGMRNNMLLVLVLLASLVSGCLFDGDETSKRSTTGITVTGKVVDTKGQGVSGVAVTLNGGSVYKTSYTSGSGTYTFAGVPNGTYAVDITRSGFTFSPKSREVKVSGENMTVENFVIVSGILD